MQFEELTKETKENWQKVIKHPFVEEIFSGELPEDKFKFYLKQDYYYLNQSMRNMAILISKVDQVSTKQQLIDVIYSEANVEFAKYEELLNHYEIKPENFENMEMTYANIAYSNYLLAVSSQSTYAEGLAALIPCYWTYLKMAEVNMDKLNYNDNHIYRDWASVFQREEFKELVNSLIMLLEAEINADNFLKIRYHFNNSIKFEYEFFDDIYHQRLWKI